LRRNMSGKMRRCPLLHICAVQLMFSAAFAQLRTPPAVTAIYELPGPPKNPRIFSALTEIWQGQLQHDDNINVKGSVVKVIREESQTPENNPDPFHRRSVLSFDAQEHLVQRVDESPMGVSTTTLEWFRGRLKST